MPRLLERAEYAGALRAVGEAIAKIAEDDAALFRLQGRAHLGLGSTPEALASLRRAIDLEPDLAPAYFDMALCYGARKDRRSAYTALTMALRLGFRDLVAIRNDDRLDGIEESGVEEKRRQRTVTTSLRRPLSHADRVGGFGIIFPRKAF